MTEGKKGSTATDWDMTNYKIINEEGKKGEYSD